MVSELSKKKHGFNRTAKTGPGRKGRFNYRTESKMDDQASPSSLTSSRASSKTSPWTPSMTPPPLPEPTTTFQSFQLEKFGDYEGSESDVSTWRLFNAVFFGGGGRHGTQHTTGLLLYLDFLTLLFSSPHCFGSSTYPKGSRDLGHLATWPETAVAKSCETTTGKVRTLSPL